jgi:hypothetical protein
MTKGNKLKSYIEKQDTKCHVAIPIEIQVVNYNNFFAIGKSTMSLVIKEVV